MAIIFNGKKATLEKEGGQKKRVVQLNKKGVVPKLVSISVGDNKVSEKYLSLKKDAAIKVGAEMEIRNFDTQVKKEEIVSFIKQLNSDDGVHGVMLQLPLPSTFIEKDRDEIVNTIDRHKDVDGMREDSVYVAPVVKSVLKALGEAYQHTIYNREVETVVVGANGFVGKKMLYVLKDMGYSVKGVDVNTEKLSDVTKNADILISTTGVAKLIKGDMVKKDAIAIDVGSPEGDFAKEEVVRHAKFVSAVPGGVGPLTIYYLLENLIEAASGL